MIELKFKTSVKPAELLPVSRIVLIVFIIGLVLVYFNFPWQLTLPILLISGGLLISLFVQAFHIFTYYKFEKDSIVLKFTFRKIDIPYSDIKQIERVEANEALNTINPYITSDYCKNQIENNSIKNQKLINDYLSFNTADLHLKRHPVIIIKLHKGTEFLINPENIDTFLLIFKSKI